MDLNFNNILKSFRIERNITQKKLCHGLCSISMLSHIEKGDRFPDYALRMRLYKRLGLASGRLINFLSPSEYELWSLKKEIAKRICYDNDNNISDLMSSLSEAILPGDVISLQFMYAIKAYEYIQTLDYKNALNIYEDVISLTLKNINSENLSEYAIAPVEYYYLLMRLKCQSMIDSYDKIKISYAYQKLISHIEEYYMDLSTKAEIYPLAVIEYINFKQDNIAFNAISVMPLIEQATNLLQKTSKTYFLKELLKMTMIISNNTPQAIEIYQRTKEVHDALNKIYSLTELNSDTLSPFYFY